MDARTACVLGALVAVVLAAAGATPARAASQETLPQDNSGLDQYVESLPEAEGDRAPSRGSRRSRSLPTRTQRALERSAEGRLLEELSTSSGLGAPAASKQRKPRSKDEDTDAASAAASTVFDSDHDAVAILAAVLLALTVAGALLGVRLRRARARE